MIYYKQCMLQRSLGDKIGKTIVWIPEKFAIENKYLKIKKGENWENGWLVKKVYDDNRVKEKEILDSHKVTKSHKKKTGDSLKKEDI